MQRNLLKTFRFFDATHKDLENPKIFTPFSGVSPQSFYIQNPAAAAAATNFQIPTGQFAHNYQMPNLPNSGWFFFFEKL